MVQACYHVLVQGNLMFHLVQITLLFMIFLDEFLFIQEKLLVTLLILCNHCLLLGDLVTQFANNLVTHAYLFLHMSLSFVVF